MEFFLIEGPATRVEACAERTLISINPRSTLAPEALHFQQGERRRPDDQYRAGVRLGDAEKMPLRNIRSWRR